MTGSMRSSIRDRLPRGRAGRALASFVAVFTVFALLGAAYVVGAPPAREPALTSTQSSDGRLSVGVPAPGYNGVGTDGAGSVSQDGSKVVNEQSSSYTSVLSPQIITTGQLSLEVADIDKAVVQARSTVVAAGGSVSSSYQSGYGDSKSASFTYRIPSAKWDETINSLRAIGSKVISEQTNTSDVTMQVVDLNARIENLQTTEAALQALMAKATEVKDILEVQNQLSNVRGQIEELTAQKNQLANQVSMSTLTVTFQLPTKPITIQAQHDWTFSEQVDQAVAALVRIGQGLATIGIWLAIVVLPILIGLAVLIGIVMIVRRIGRRGRNQAATPA